MLGYTVGELAEVEPETLQAVGSFGEVTVGEIHDPLTKLGFRPAWPRPRKK